MVEKRGGADTGDAENGGMRVFSLTSAEMAAFLLSVIILLAAAHALGFLAERIAIPRVIGEVAAGLLLGPTLLGRWFPEAFHRLFDAFPSHGKLLGLMAQFGLILLMFTSGLKFQPRFEKSDGIIGSAIVIGSTIFPFAAGWLFTFLFNPAPFLGPAQNTTALKIVVAVSIAVTSIPVLSKILYDLGVIHTRFAKLVIAVAGIHDTLLWMALAVASGLVTSQPGTGAVPAWKSVAVTGGFIVMCLLAVPKILRRLNGWKANILFRASFLGYILIVLFALSDLAGYLGIDIMFGALLAGIATRLTLPEHLFRRVENSLREISFSFFVPVYFVLVGIQLDLARHFSLPFFLLYLLFATAAQGFAVYGTCRAIRLDRLSSLNLAAAMNARGGPGIVLSTVAYSLGIINQDFFSVIVMLSLVSSWMAGSWLRYVLRTGRPLMPGDERITLLRPQEEARLDPLPKHS